MFVQDIVRIIEAFFNFILKIFEALGVIEPETTTEAAE